MSEADGGFYFDFGESPEQQPAIEGTSFRWTEPNLSVLSFPWLNLDDNQLSAWRSAYPSGSSSSRTRPLTFEVTSCSSGVQYQLCYQTPPQIDELTLGEQAGVEHRDIIPGRYYGGLKVWSCAPDLARFLLERDEEYRALFRGGCGSEVIVAEIGCGHALPGLAALCLGANQLVLQDYNEEVLQSCVCPNVAATVANEITKRGKSSTEGLTLSSDSRVKLLHGDWVDFLWDEEVKCDVILGSDVTFDKEACEKLAVLLSRWLKPQTGFALIASKEYYFGTNGGRVELIDSVKRYGLRVETLQYYRDGGSMDRVILKVCQAA